MITVQREQIADIRAELEPLLVAHWREIAHYQDILLEPDWAFYCSSPFLRCFTVRMEGVLVGYLITGVAKNKHYMSSLQAMQDILFVHPDHRGSDLGRTLLRYHLQQMTQEKVQVDYQHVKRSHPALGLLLESAGYEPVEIIYAKRLDKEKPWP